METKDKTIVITGASDGIGAVAARQLHNQGARVVITGRSPQKTKSIGEELGVKYNIADFSRLAEVRKLAGQLKGDYPRIDVLINNAGGVFGNRELTVDGHEKTLQVNHLAHFFLTTLLLDTLVESQATVINVSSIANARYGNIDLKDLDLAEGFTPNRAYGNAKLANILFTKELHKRYNAGGISTVAVHPGNIATNFASDTTSFFRFIYHTPLSKLILENPEKGADPLVWLATSTPGTDWQPGEYYEKRKIGKPNPQALDSELAKKLWEVSEDYTG